jgi:hypothetical protein
MWALLSTRLRTWLLLAVAVPLAGAIARAVASRLERRNGSTKLSRALFTAGDLATRHSKGGRRDSSAGGREVTNEGDAAARSRR